jgi:hypothetical protein
LTSIIKVIRCILMWLMKKQQIFFMS